MNWKHLFWIIPATTLVVFIIAFFWGASVSWNIVADKCNTNIKFNNQLNELENQVCDQAINMWELYETRCPQVYYQILNGEINLTKEFKKMELEE